MATGIGNLPYPMAPVSPFDVITSQAQNERIANIEALADGSGIGDGSITTSTINDAAVTPQKIDFGTLIDANGWTLNYHGAKKVYHKTFSGISTGNLNSLMTATPVSGQALPVGIRPVDYLFKVSGGTSNGTVFTFYWTLAVDLTSTSTTTLFDINCRNLASSAQSGTNGLVQITLIEK